MGVYPEGIQQDYRLCGLKYLSDLNAVDVGYRFMPEYWGNGIATEACIASLDFGFGRLALNEIIGIVMPENTASIRVLEKSGMQFRRHFEYDGFHVARFAKQATESAENNATTQSGG